MAPLYSYIVRGSSGSTDVRALAPFILAPEPRRVAVGYLFFLPWLFPVFAVSSLPFVFAAFRAFRLDVATRRNHALEHATILELEARSGRRLTGRSSRTGFRVSGHVSIDDVRRAFNRVSVTLRAGEPLVYISPRCGSNIVTAIGTGVVLLLALVGWSVAFQPSWTLRTSVLAAVVGLFAALRHALGNAIQRRFFMAVDFADVSLRDLRHVPPGVFDRGPVVFVETIVRPQSRASTR
jgi:hypothetical protein